VVYEGCNYQRAKRRETVRMIQEALDKKAETARLKVEEAKARKVALKEKKAEAETKTSRKWW
jgi:hypothetical protein